MLPFKNKNIILSSSSGKNVSDTGTLFLAVALKIQDFLYHQDENEIAIRQVIQGFRVANWLVGIFLLLFFSQNGFLVNVIEPCCNSSYGDEQCNNLKMEEIKYTLKKMLGNSQESG